MDFIDEGKTGKVKLYDIYKSIYEDCDSALADDFYKGLKSKMNQKKNIDLADAEVQLYIRDFLESHENDYQYDLLKQALEPYYDHTYDLADEDIQEAYEVLEEDVEEDHTFEEIIDRMEFAEIYEDLYNAAMCIANPKLQTRVTKAIQQCEDDGDDVEEAYSIVTSDILDMYRNDKNIENLNETKLQEAKDIKTILEELNVSSFEELNEKIEELYNEGEIDEEYDDFIDISSEQEEKCIDYINRRSEVTNTDWKDELGIEEDYVKTAIEEMIKSLSLEENKKLESEEPNTHSLLSKVFANYPDISDEDEDYLNGLNYEELVNELKNRGWDDLLEESKKIKTEDEESKKIKVSKAALQRFENSLRQIKPYSSSYVNAVYDLLKYNFGKDAYVYKFRKDSEMDRAIKELQKIEKIPGVYYDESKGLNSKSIYVSKDFGDYVINYFKNNSKKVAEDKDDKEEAKKIKTEVKKTLDDVYSDPATESLWDEKFNELVPEEGKANTDIGEIMRCFASMSHAYLQNGEIIANMQQYYLDKVWELDDILKDFGDSTLSGLLDKMYNTRSKSAYDHYMAEFYEYFVNNYLKKEVKEESEENPQEFDYRLLSRLKSDCDYYLGNGNRNAEHCLWAKNEQGQIDKMREIYNKLKEKPEWLSEEDINNYAKEMGVVDLPSTTDGTAEKEIQDMLDRAEKREKEGLTEAEDMEAVKDEIETAKEETENTDQEIEQVQGSIDVLKTDEESAIDGYDTFIKDTKEVVDKELADTIENQMEEIKADEEEHIEKLDTIKDALDEAKGQAPDFKVDFEGDMTIDIGYTDEEGAEKRAKELLDDVAKSTNVRDLNVDVKDVKRMEKENKTLTESEEKFSGTEFEKNIPHVMRFKQYDVEENKDGKTLYWVTQQFFTLEELKKFQEAFISKLANDKFGFTEAYVTVRDLSTYDFNEDYENGVLCYITPLELDYEGYEEFCKEDYNFDLYKGWLDENKELKKEDKIIWTSEYQGDEETAGEAYQEYLDEFEPTPIQPKSFEDWLEGTFESWLESESDAYIEEHPEVKTMKDWEIDDIDYKLREKVQKEIDANMDDLKDQYEEYVQEINESGIMTKPSDKEKWQIGWYEQDAEAQWEAMSEDFSSNVWPMIQNQCKDDILILLGSVGRWNGTFDGGKIIHADEKNIRNIMGDYDEVTVSSDDEGHISMGFNHHDGTDGMYLYTIPEDLTELAKAMNYDDPDELDTDIRQDYVDMEELSKHVDKLTPIIYKGGNE